MKAQKGTIYFDGLCVVCSKEIDHYRKLPGSENFNFVDITDASFKPQEHGIDPHQVHRWMHVRDPDGKLHQGVDAFRAIWKELPRYFFLYRLSEARPVRAAMELGYRVFVRIRPYLPRREADCSKSPYCEVHHE